MKALITLLVVLVINIGYSQDQRIIKLNNQLNLYIQNYDDENIIKTAIDLKSLLKENQSVDTMSIMSMDCKLSTSYNNLTRYEKTIEIYNSYAQCRFCENDKYFTLYGSILGSSVTAFSNIHKYDLALEINNKVISLFEKSTELVLRRCTIQSRIEGARILINSNRLDEAEVELNKVITQCKTDYSNYNDLIINFLGVKSEFFEKKSDLYGSLGCLLEIDNIYKEEINQKGMINALRSKNLMDISDYYSNVFDYTSALFYSKKAVECYDKSNVNDYTKSIVYSHLSGALWNVDSIDASFAAYEKAIAWNDKIYGKNSIYNLIPITRMSVLTSNSHFDQSIEISKNGLKLLGKSEDYQLGAEQLFENISNVYANPNYIKRNQDSSINYAIKYKNYVIDKIGENSEQHINSIQLIGFLYSQFDDSENAIPYAREYKDRILTILGADHYLYRSALNSLAVYYQQIDNIAEAEVIRLELAMCWNNYIQDNFLALVGNLQNNKGIIDAIDYSLYFVEKNLNFLKLEDSKTIPYENLLLVKNLQLSSLQSLRNDLQNNEQLTSKLNLYNQLKTSANSKEDRLKISQLETELLANSTIFREIKEGKELKLRDVNKYLKSGQVFIDFARIADPSKQDFKYIAIILDGNSTIPQYVDCGLEKNIINDVGNKDMYGLYINFWQYIEKHIPKQATELIFSPIYELNNVSFAAICDNKSTAQNSFENRNDRGVIIGSNVKEYSCNYLIDKYKIRYVQSARSLTNMIPTLNSKSSVLAIGGVEYNILNTTNAFVVEKSNPNNEINNELYETIKDLRNALKLNDFGFLPNTEIEVDQIAKECKQKYWKVKLLKSTEADEISLTNTISKNYYEILHFATHGFSIPENLVAGLQSDPFNRCGLVLAGGNKSWESRENANKMIEKYGHDGILTGNEVLNLPISKTKLVVLSACETSLGKIQGMESSQSLSRVFLMAGVDCVISSLWSVPDKETMELMTLFYTDLTKTLNPVISFEKAQKEMRNKYPTDPEKWAGFVLVL